MLSVRGYKSLCLCFYRLLLLPLLPLRQNITIPASSVAGTYTQTHTADSNKDRAKKHDDGNGWLDREYREKG